MRQLRALVAIARLGSFTRAAQALHLSQPALTVQIHQLEGALGVRLVDRNTRSVRLTPLGGQLVPVVERALADIDKAIAATRLTPESLGLVTVAALPSLCANIMPAAIAAFNAQHPGISLRLRETSAARLASAVLEEAVEFGIGIVERPVSQLQTAPFMTDRLVVVCPASHPLARRSKVLLHELAAHPIIALDTLSTARRLLESALHAGGHASAPAHEVSFVSTAIGMVRAGLGVTVMSSSALGRAVMTGLQARLIERPELNRDIVVVRKKDRTLSPAAERLLQCAYAARDATESNVPRPRAKRAQRGADSMRGMAGNHRRIPA